MKPVEGCCSHGELLDKYCPECAKEDKEAEMNEFNPKEGDWVIVGMTADSLCNERIFAYKNKHGSYMCVHGDDGEEYIQGCCFRVTPWPYAKPLPPPKLPQFIEGDPIIVWVHDKSTERTLIVHSVTEDGIKCFWDGRIDPYAMPLLYPCYKPLPNYNYGNRKVWGSEDNK